VLLLQLEMQGVVRVPMLLLVLLLLMTRRRKRRMPLKGEKRRK
jgi:hypothetical protein